MYELTKLKDIISDNRIRKQLFKNGFRTPESLIFIEKFKDKLRGKIPFFPEDINEIKYINSLIISTGCRSLDDMLGGGVETGAVTEFVGEFGTGKTQICHQLSVTVQLPADMGGLEAGAIYIDTEGTFRPERIIQIASYRGIEPKKALKNIIYARAYNSDHQILLIDEVRKIIPEKNIRLLILDSLVGHFRSEYPGREFLAVRQQKLNKHVHQLLEIADIFNIAVVVTNQVLSVPDTFFGNPLRPAGGNIVAHGCTYRVWLRKGKDNRRLARIFVSPSHPEVEVVFQITENGVEDV